MRNTQCLVNAAEVVVHEMERNRVSMILDFFGERIGESWESAEDSAGVSRARTGKALGSGGPGFRDHILVTLHGDIPWKWRHAAPDQ